jgi:hypothetical protein
VCPGRAALTVPAQIPFHGLPDSFASPLAVALHSPTTDTAVALGAHTRNVTPLTTDPFLLTVAPNSTACTDTSPRKRTHKKAAANQANRVGFAMR